MADFEQVLRESGGIQSRWRRSSYKILMGPVQADLDQAKAETLVWSLDGALRYVPMAALYDGKQYALREVQHGDDHSGQHQSSWKTSRM